jgi:outer membrane protein
MLSVLVLGTGILVPVGEARAQVAGSPEPPVPPVLTLEQAIDLALDHAPAAVAAEASVSAARADLLQTRGSLLPSLAVSSTYNNSSNQRFDQATGQLVSENYAAQLTSSYETFSGGRRLAQLRAAGAGLDAADARRGEQTYVVVLHATETYYAAAAAADLAAVAEQRLVRARQQEEFAANRYELGTATTSDLLRAQIEVANAELSAMEAQSALRVSSLELGRLVGVPGGARPADAALPVTPPALPGVDDLIARALRSAPAVRAAEAVRASRRAERLVTWLTGAVPDVVAAPAAPDTEPAPAVAREAVHSS